MKVVVDVDLVFEYLYLVVAFARKERVVLEGEIEGVRGKSVQDALRILGVLSDEDEVMKLFATVRFKIEGFQVFHRYSEEDEGIGLVGNIEEVYANEILKANKLEGVRFCQWENLTGDVKVITGCVSRKEQMDQSGVLSEIYLPQPYLYDDLTMPWQGHYKLPSSQTIVGCIEKGFGRGSKDLGFPTANIGFYENLKILPGIYAGVVKLEGELYKAAVSVGWCPFYSNPQISYEAYIMHSFSGSLVGKSIECELQYYLRCESKFVRMPDLIRAIQLDVFLCEQLLK